MRRLAIGAAALVASAASAPADVITFNLTSEFSGAQQPAGWLQAVFADISGGVQLTLTSMLVGTEFATEWVFNLNPVLDPTKLMFAKTGSTGAFANPGITTGVDKFKPDGDGKYDIQFLFATDGTGRFGAGEEVIYKITSTQTIDAHSFDFLSTPAGGHGPYPTAAHVQGIGGEGGGSGWITIPLPQTAWLGLGGLALAGAVSAIRRRG
ncbi:MAG: hypothetical protein ACF8R7_01660 [Phycisphaerales bacterium JB039]